MWEDLMQAIEENRIEEAIQLAERINERDLDRTNQNGQTVLHYAVLSGSQEMCEFLIPKMSLAAVEAKDRSKDTAWGLAKKMENDELYNLVCTQVIQKKIEEGDRLISSDHNEAVLIIGTTGVGKSTLVNYLTNPANLKVVRYSDEDNPFDEGNLVIDHKNPNTNAPKMGHKKDSETTLPNKWQSVDGKLIYWDCPGFDDTNGSVQDISNAFYIKKIFDTTKKTKVVLVMESRDLEAARANDIKKLADTLGNLFSASQLTDVIKGLSLVITKSDPATLNSIKGKIFGMLKANCFNEYSKGKEILSSLILPQAGQRGLNDVIDKCFAGNQEVKSRLEPLLGLQDKIAIFKKPEQEGDIIEVLGENESILSIIDNTEFIEEPEVQITVSSDSRLMITNLAKKATGTLKENANALITKVKENYYVKSGELKGQGRLAELKKLQDKTVSAVQKVVRSDIDHLEENIGIFANSLIANEDKISKLLLLNKACKEATGFTLPVEFNYLLSAYLDQGHDSSLTEGILKNLRYLQFFKQIENEVHLDKADWFKELINVRDNLLKYTYLPDEKVIQIRGETIYSEDINQGIGDNCLNAIKAVEVYTQKLVLNGDLRHEKLKGINFLVVAPKWKIVGNPTINLSGKEGEAYTTSALNGFSMIEEQLFWLNMGCQASLHYLIPSGANQLILHFLEKLLDMQGNPGLPGNPGANGLPGHPGYNGGNFFGVGEEFTGLENLIIDVSGGRGGKGQKGGDGTNGTNSTKNGNEDDVKKRKPEALKYHKIEKNEIGGSYYSIEHYESRGLEGGGGGDAGIGGKGGIGGYPGRVLLKINYSPEKPKVLINYGQMGEDGTPGKAGIGGKSGIIYSGKYINHKLKDWELTTEFLKGFATDEFGDFCSGNILGSGKLLGYITGDANPLLRAGIFTLELIGQTSMDKFTHSQKTWTSSVYEAAMSIGAKNAIKYAGIVGLTYVGAPIFAISTFNIACGLVTRPIINTTKTAVSAYINSGWQQEGNKGEVIRKSIEQANKGNISNEKNVIEIKYPNEQDHNLLNNHFNQIIIRYNEYVKLLGLEGTISVKAMHLDLGNIFTSTTPNKSNTQNLPYKICKNEQAIQLNQEVTFFRQNLSDPNPESNAFNQKNNPNYYYQAHDIRLIQEEIMGNYKNDFIIRNLIDAEYIEQVFSLLRETKESGKPGLCIVDYGNHGWKNLIVLNHQDELISRSIGTNFLCVDGGILALRNMQIAAEKILSDKDSFIKNLQNYQDFCTLEEAKVLRKDFAAKYALNIYHKMVVREQKNLVMCYVDKKLKESITNVSKHLKQLEVSGDNPNILTLEPGEKLDKEHQKKIDSNGYVSRVGSAVAVKIKIKGFSEEDKTFEYYYKINWTQDLNWGEDIFIKIMSILSKSKEDLGEIKEDRERKVISIIPARPQIKYECDLQNQPIKIDLHKLCRKLYVKPEYAMLEELRDIITDYSSYDSSSVTFLGEDSNISLNNDIGPIVMI